MAREELRHTGVRKALAAADDDQVIGDQGHLGHQVAGDEDGTAFVGHRAQQVAQPADASRVQAVDARRLFLAEKTVRNHVSRIFTKLEVHDRAAAALGARDAGFGNQADAVLPQPA
ncbi:LuxR C-terminal-related transcriptional regulator [Streptomyces canus]|uniref:LuxR C-terminal-related transcriptional regulator n=1 Tax=Streptomyces canus TaxID=58343 RepID=UPI002781C52B|nr:hypothetical protein [Streptomyces canus]